MTSKWETPLEKMPEVLRWSNGKETLREVHDAYVRRMSDALGAYLRKLRMQSPSLAAPLISAVKSCSDEALFRVLLAPESVARLLFPRVGELTATAAFLGDALAAESALGGHPKVYGRELWTALGDARALPMGEILRSRCAAGCIPLDLDSPHGRSDESICGDASGRTRTVLTEDERLVAFDRLHVAYEVLVGAGLADFVSVFTKVLVLRKDQTVGFSSGSETRYIGRSMLGNPHNPGIDHLDLAEALVHEAVHTMLYMEERRDAWVPAALYAAVPRVVSPWSQRTLALRPFLQACFVWYGLLQFWGRVTMNGTLPSGQVAERMLQAAKGFLGPPLLGRLSQEDVDAVAPGVRRAITEMQNVVQDALT